MVLDVEVPPSPNADMNDGSFDPNAVDTFTLRSVPRGPLLLGDTVVTLTATAFILRAEFFGICIWEGS